VQCSGVTSSKHYVVQRVLNGKTRRVTVGHVNEITLEQARDEASDLIHQMRHGQDPKAKPAKTATLEETFRDYLATRKSLRPASKKSYTKYMNYLTPWLEKPLNEITADMVMKRHGQLQEEISAAGRYAATAPPTWP